MKKVTPNGSIVKQLREHLERGSTQKELAHAVGNSERQLRSIENQNAAVPVASLDRLAKALGVHRDRIAYSVVPAATTDLLSLVPELGDEPLVPRART
ncbi:MAG: hypothetical protein JWL62_462 [Hyphomicrobiales bacterium]|nr:hypothetical protein [Hyphomicrobiales bacterium]